MRNIGGFSFVHNLLHMTGQFTPQPFVTAHNETVALFNGEIYNYRKLQRVLRPAGPPYATAPTANAFWRRTPSRARASRATSRASLPSRPTSVTFRSRNSGSASALRQRAPSPRSSSSASRRDECGPRAERGRSSVPRGAARGRHRRSADSASTSQPSSSSCAFIAIRH